MRASESPVLEGIRVASSCRARWDDMAGDARVRACGDCKQNVYNLTALTRAEAEALILAKAGQLCVRYYQRADGTIVLNDCVVGDRRRSRGLIAAGLAAGVTAGLAGSLLAIDPEPSPSVDLVADGSRPEKERPKRLPMRDRSRGKWHMGVPPKHDHYDPDDPFSEPDGKRGPASPASSNPKPGKGSSRPKTGNSTGTR
jgi:hypothetical protein